MNIFEFLVVGLLTLQLAATAVVKRDISPNIIGGSTARQGQFPHQVALFHQVLIGKNLFCGGAILNENFILTSAYCTRQFTVGSTLVRAGEQDLSSTSEFEQEVKSSRFIIHPNATSNANDIALIQLATPLQFNANVQPIKLPAVGTNILVGEECVVSGWGAIEEGGSASNLLKFVYVPAVSDSQCIAAYPNEVDSSAICTGFDVGGAGFCKFDWGGPLSCGDVKDTVNGISSWSTGCARPGLPGIYTDVSLYVDWIRQEIAQAA